MSESETKHSDQIVIAEPSENLPNSAARTPKRPWWKLGGADVSFTTVDSASVTTSSSGSLKEDIESSTQNNIHGSVFDDSRAAQFYQPVEKYEGRHRFDPSATWTSEEEQRLVRTVRLFGLISRTTESF
jgi:hypothetical protein